MYDSEVHSVRIGSDNKPLHATALQTGTTQLLALNS